MGRSGHRRRNLVVGFVALGLLSLLVVVATPIVQTQLIGWAFSSLEQRYGIVGYADVIDIDLASLDIRFEGLTLATRERADDPFLLSMRPGSTFRGRPSGTNSRSRR